jgi:hypothetical protein
MNATTVLPAIAILTALAVWLLVKRGVGVR